MRSHNLRRISPTVIGCADYLDFLLSRKLSCSKWFKISSQLKSDSIDLERFHLLAVGSVIAQKIPLSTSLHVHRVLKLLLACLSSQVSTSNITNKDVINMSITTSESWKLPATCIAFIWEDRVAGNISSLIRFIAELLAKVALLRRTKWKHYSPHNSVVLLDEAINLHFI